MSSSNTLKSSNPSENHLIQEDVKQHYLRYTYDLKLFKVAFLTTRGAVGQCSDEHIPPLSEMHAQ